jgi:transcriptional regulator GlxA family with amidase domain
MFPAVQVEGDRVFLKRGVWTSAGVTAEIDMTLALIEEDLGREIARAVARMLAVTIDDRAAKCSIYRFSILIPARIASGPR